jgi:hypothetical protein
MFDTKMTKSAGEHWVCSILSQHGWGVALTRDGLERTDILAVHTIDPDRPMVEVQVKSLQHAGHRSSWPLGTKAQIPARSGREWFVLVLLGKTPTDRPRAFVVPRDHVAAAAWIQHMAWLNEPGVPAGQRNVGPDRSRVEVSVFERYEERWDLLLSSAHDAPILLPTRHWHLAQDSSVALPPDHPWRTRLPSAWD